MNPMFLAAAVLAGGLPPPEASERPVHDFRNFATGYGGYGFAYRPVNVRHGGSEHYRNTRSQKRKRRDMRRRFPHGW